MPTFVSVVLGWLALPQDPAKADNGKTITTTMDWLGAALMFPTLMLATFAVADSAHAPCGWKTIYIYMSSIAAGVLFGLTVYVEGWIAKHPLLPSSVFRSARLMLHLLGLFFINGAFGIWLLYTVFHVQNIRDVDPTHSVAWFAPSGVGGLVLAVATGFLLRKIPLEYLMIVSGLGSVMAPLLLALASEGSTYWQYVFPSILCATVGIDITYNIGNIYVTANLPLHQQGLAGGICNTVLFVGIRLATGLADSVVAASFAKGLLTAYKSAFWLAFGLATVGLLLNLAFVVDSRRNKRSITTTKH